MWEATGDQLGLAVGPERSFDSRFFSILLGSGTLLTSRRAIGYKLLQNNNTLAATSIGRNNVDLLIGGSFNLGIKKGARVDAGVTDPWSAFISLKFSPGSTETINGFVFGGGYRITKYLDIIVGVGLTPKNEPAIGLRRVAFNKVIADPNNPAFIGFVPDDLLLNRSLAPFDGFPLIVDGEQIFPGDPLVRKYHVGIFFGVAFPLDIGKLLAGAGQNR